jgi:tetratricopeptide (TPR) repeat protein
LALTDLGIAVYEQGDYSAARTLFAESLKLYQKMSAKQGIALVLNNMGTMAHRQGEYLTAQELQAEALALFQELGAKEGAAITLNSLGHLAIEQANSVWQPSLVICRIFGAAGRSVTSTTRPPSSTARGAPAPPPRNSRTMPGQKDGLRANRIAETSPGEPRRRFNDAYMIRLKPF